MLSKQGFNLWADGYDQSVQLSEERNEYPFAGYKAILNAIYQEIRMNPGSSVLDIGIGTGVLAAKLAEHGHVITGIDFSESMLVHAKKRIPNGQFLQWDIHQGVPLSIPRAPFDAIVSTYTLHHLTDLAKLQLLKQVANYLKPDGVLYIGDISFATRHSLEECRKKNLHHWDDAEYYFVYEEIERALSNEFIMEYTQASHCGGWYKIKLR